MKNYKLLIPVALVLVFAVSIYMTFDRNLEKTQAYTEALKAARESAAMEVWVDAEKYYQEALQYDDSIGMYLEIGNMYLEFGQIKKALDWGETMTDKYPRKPEGYEYLFDLYLEREDYAACNTLYDKFRKLGLQSERVEEGEQAILYQFFFTGEYRDVSEFSSGYCAVSKQELWGYVNETGASSISGVYSEAGAFYDDVAPVIDEDEEVYYIDTKGNRKKVVLGVDSIQQLGMYANELAPVLHDGVWGFYRVTGEVLCDGFEEVTAFREGIALVCKDGKWSIIGTNGEAVSDETYDGCVTDARGVAYRFGRIFVEKDFQYELLNGAGEKVTEERFEAADVFRDDTCAAVKKDGRWGFIDLDGNVVIEPKYEAARSFSNGLAAVRYAGKWGFIDLNGNMVIETQFDDAKDFTGSGSVFVKENETWKLLRLYSANH